jgi:hypothetical protein
VRRKISTAVRATPGVEKDAGLMRESNSNIQTSQLQIFDSLLYIEAGLIVTSKRKEAIFAFVFVVSTTAEVSR